MSNYDKILHILGADIEDGTEKELMVTVTSDKDPLASLGSGISVDFSTTNIDDLGDDWVYDITGDAFWEGLYSFEDGFQSVKEMLEINDELEVEDALKKVFGHFVAAYTIDDKPCDLVYDIDFDGLIYPLLCEYWDL